MVQKSRQDFLLLIALNILASLCFFYPILGRLNTILMSVSGDGMKNYFCYLFYIQHDAGSHFSGMNYPFGENIIFTDNMPALAWTIAKLKVWFPGIVQYCLALMHSTFIISYFLSAVFIYKILKLYGVKGWWLPVSAVFIAYFSPQFSRLFGHFSLGLGCFFPMVIYWLMQYERNKKARYLLFFFALTVLFTFLHVYYLAFGLVLATAYCFSWFVTQRRSLKQKLWYTLPVLVTVAATAITFKLFLRLTDHITDRPLYPTGYLTTGTKLDDILTSYYNFIGSNVFSLILRSSARDTEGYTYPGLITLLVICYLLYRVVKSIIIRLAKQKKVPVHPVRSYRAWLLTALLTLLFGMGIPFIWGFDFISDHISLFRQFRSLGRFSWIFYYLLMIYASIFLYRWFSKMKRSNYRKQYFVLASLIVLIWAIEWNGYGQKIRAEGESAIGNYHKFKQTGTLNWQQWLKQQGYSPENLQGIIGLPYTHIGSEKVGFQEDYHYVIFTGAQMAMETGLKMVDVMMSRTSWSQTFENLRLFDGPFSDKPIVSRFNDKPFLLFVYRDVPLTPGEENLVRNARFIGNRNNADVYVLDMKSMVQLNKQYADSLKNIALSLPQPEGLVQSSAFAYSNHFDHCTFKSSFAGAAALAVTRVPDTIVIPVTHPTNDSMFVVSGWFLCNDRSSNMPYVSWTQYSVEGKMITSGDYSAAGSTHVMGDWFYAEKVICIDPRTNKISLSVHNRETECAAFDELLIYPVNSVYFYKAPNGSVLLNNRVQ